MEKSPSCLLLKSRIIINNSHAMREKHRIKDEELPFFYNILYRYEAEERKGLNYQFVEKELRSVVNLQYKQKDVSGPISPNTIRYSGGCVSVDLLRHVRNAFAHGNIRSDDSKNIYSFYDEWHGQCNMKGIMNKDVFRKLINAIFETKDGKKVTPKRIVKQKKLKNK